MTQRPSPLRIDMISDVVCPWCIVGYQQLKQALDAADIAYDLHWHPFELNPDMGADGQNLQEHIVEKYGVSIEHSNQTRRQLTEIGEGLGFAFEFGEDTRIYNTFAAHQLLHWADQQGRQHDLKQALFAAYFSDGINLADPEALANVAAKIGLSRDAALQVLDDQRFAQDVRHAERHWVSQGVRGVPAIVFNQRHLVTGAQGVDNYTNILSQLAEMEG